MIKSELQSLSPSALLEFFEIDLTSVGGEIVRFHAGTNGLTQPVTWQGNLYTPYPIEATGFDLSAKGTLPRPRIRVANVDGVLSYDVMRFDDLVGQKLIRRRTFARFLDAVNFPGGVNAEADPDQHLPDDVWYVEQKLSENRLMIEWELASPFDLIGVLLPRRQIIQNSCPWGYRGPECGYVGTSYFNTSDQPCGPADDSCAKRLGSCQLRFPTGSLPFGGFPGVLRY